MDKEWHLWGVSRNNANWKYHKLMWDDSPCCTLSGRKGTVQRGHLNMYPKNVKWIKGFIRSPLKCICVVMVYSSTKRPQPLNEHSRSPCNMVTKETFSGRWTGSVTLKVNVSLDDLFNMLRGCKCSIQMIWATSEYLALDQFRCVPEREEGGSLLGLWITNECRVLAMARRQENQEQAKGYLHPVIL